MPENPSARNWRRVDDDAGIAWLYLDVVDSASNVLSAAVLDELDGLLQALAEAPPRGVVFVSGKPGGFIAGADVREFTKVETSEQALTLIQRGQRVMDRVDDLPCPTLALVEGFCLGGGLELALACDYRIALDEPTTRLGFPEIKLGIHPGFGGSVRAVRTLGPLSAMDLMLTGRSLDAQRARKAGLIDHAVPRRHLYSAARELVQTHPAPAPLGRVAKLLNTRPLRALLAARMRRQVAGKAPKAHYPAPYALIDLWARHAGDERRMLAQEARSVAELSATATARNLVRVFLLQERLKAQGDKRSLEPRHVHVIGAGLMGGDIAAWCVQQGLRVTVQDPHTESLAATRQRAAQLFQKRLKSERLVARALDRLIPDAEGAGLAQADAVIEAIFEDVEAKQAIYRAIEPVIKPEALLATNTSSLPIETLAQALDRPARLVGLHFFNPVARLPLVEIVRGPQTEDTVVQKALAFARHIDKLPLEVKSTPGFLVNRVLMPYLLEAALMAEEGVPNAVIDKTATDFGMPMGPIELADTVGLDVGLHVGEVLARAYGFQIPSALRDKVDAGKLGRKSGEGFYQWKNGKPVPAKRARYTGDTNELQQRLLLRLVNEALACEREQVAADADLIDAGMIFGTGFAPFRGGPLHYRDARGHDIVRQELARLEGRYGARFAVAAGVQSMSS